MKRKLFPHPSRTKHALNLNMGWTRWKFEISNLDTSIFVCARVLICCTPHWSLYSKARFFVCSSLTVQRLLLVPLSGFHLFPDFSISIKCPRENGLVCAKLTVTLCRYSVKNAKSIHPCMHKSHKHMYGNKSNGRHENRTGDETNGVH